MLVLKREAGEAIEISGSGRMRITLLRVEGQTAKLTFEGDDSMVILRTELLERPDRERREPERPAA